MMQKAKTKKKEMTPERRAEIINSIKKKKESEKKALQIVEQLLENPVDGNWLLEMAHFINQNYYQDAVEERALSLCCGYPLCNNKIKSISQQKYSINLRQKKIFDVTNRKHFCSDNCYAASTYFKNQLLTSPLWLRDKEKIPKFQFMKEAKGLCGDEIEWRVIPPPKEDEEKTGVDTLQLQARKQEYDQLRINRIQSKEIKTMPNPVGVVAQALKQWISLKTLKYLLGEDIVNERLGIGIDKDDRFKEMGSSSLRNNPQYKSLCDKLDFLQLQDETTDKKLVEKTFPLKPVPSFEQLKEEVEQAKAKVKAFYSGSMEYLGNESLMANVKEKQGTVEDVDIVVPLVDSLAQKTLQRKIVLNYLNQEIPLLIQRLGLQYQEIRRDVVDLVSTLDLSPDTITFRPNELTLLGLIFLYLLSMKNNYLRQNLTDPSIQEYVEVLLEVYKIDRQFLRNVISQLTNMDAIFELNKKNNEN